MYVTTIPPVTPMLRHTRILTNQWVCPANGDLRNLRIQAHRKFDLIWKNGIMTREEAYRWFADSFGLSLRDAHIGMCSEYRCRELIRLCNEVLARNNCVA